MTKELNLDELGLKPGQVGLLKKLFTRAMRTGVLESFLTSCERHLVNRPPFWEGLCAAVQDSAGAKDRVRVSEFCKDHTFRKAAQDHLTFLCALHGDTWARSLFAKRVKNQIRAASKSKNPQAAVLHDQLRCAVMLNLFPSRSDLEKIAVLGEEVGFDLEAISEALTSFRDGRISRIRAELLECFQRKYSGADVERCFIVGCNGDENDLELLRELFLNRRLRGAGAKGDLQRMALQAYAFIADRDKVRTAVLNEFLVHHRRFTSFLPSITAPSEFSGLSSAIWAHGLIEDCDIRAAVEIVMAGNKRWNSAQARALLIEGGAIEATERESSEVQEERDILHSRYAASLSFYRRFRTLGMER